MGIRFREPVDAEGNVEKPRRQRKDGLSERVEQLEAQMRRMRADCRGMGVELPETKAVPSYSRERGSSLYSKRSSSTGRAASSTPRTPRTSKKKPWCSATATSADLIPPVRKRGRSGSAKRTVPTTPRDFATDSDPTEAPATPRTPIPGVLRSGSRYSERQVSITPKPQHLTRTLVKDDPAIPGARGTLRENGVRPPALWEDAQEDDVSMMRASLRQNGYHVAGGSPLSPSQPLPSTPPPVLGFGTAMGSAYQPGGVFASPNHLTLEKMDSRESDVVNNSITWNAAVERTPDTTETDEDDDSEGGRPVVSRPRSAVPELISLKRELSVKSQQGSVFVKSPPQQERKNSGVWVKSPPTSPLAEGLTVPVVGRARASSVVKSNIKASMPNVARFQFEGPEQRNAPVVARSKSPPVTPRSKSARRDSLVIASSPGTPVKVPPPPRQSGFSARD